MEIEIVNTEDNSQTIKNSIIDENYHSLFGAKNESQHVFIESGLNYLKNKNLKSISIFEMGFGLGVNAWLSFMASKEDLSTKIKYFSVEKHPLKTNQLTEIAWMKEPIFKLLHDCPWNKEIAVSENFCLKKLEIDIKNLTLQPEYKMDLIFFNAFSPEKQPELWSDKIFEKLYLALNTGGVLTTYCAKGIVKRTLQNVGFTVEKLAGPIGKREIIRAIKK